MKKDTTRIAFIALSIIGFGYFSSCHKVNIDTQTTSDVNIYPYLQSKPDQFSEWAKIVDKSGYAGYLTAYGAYTLFSPTNDAVHTYLTDVNKASVNDFSVAEAKDIVTLHLIQDTLATNTFKDGKLPTVTMYGQYLVAGVTNINGVSSITINRQALITQGNIRTGNGYIHALDHVLKPASKSSAQLISENPNLSVFKQALVATGFYDTINTISTSTPKRWFTVLAETNQALADSGFTSYNALFAKLCTTGNPLNPLDSMHIYVAYHIIPDARYLADIASASSHFTLQPLEVLSSKLSGEDVLINDLDFNGVHEPGIKLDRATSDVSTTTGVLHTALGHFRPKVRVPFPVYWDVADFPEVRKLPAIFRRAGASLDFAYGTLKDFNWDNPVNVMTYSGDGPTSTSFPTYYGDHLTVPMGTTSRHHWIEFRTPLLVKGKYNIWICYRAAKGSGTLTSSTPTGGSNCPVQVSFDGIPTSRQFNFCIQRPLGTDGELLALGWKKYSDSSRIANSTAYQFMSGKFVGSVDVSTTDRHIVRFDVQPAAGTGNPSNFLDMIHFIPVDWPSQYLPRMGTNGAFVNF
ncbi:MAG: fasciclin domain-containing protein [Bacteroidota bacterium]|nr:fasciclin domain-containing protein [Bacteroidota bacterium]